jgi:hypothetical protein
MFRGGLISRSKYHLAFAKSLLAVAFVVGSCDVLHHITKVDVTRAFGLDEVDGLDSTYFVNAQGD